MGRREGLSTPRIKTVRYYTSTRPRQCSAPCRGQLQQLKKKLSLRPNVCDFARSPRFIYIKQKKHTDAAEMRLYFCLKNGVHTDAYFTPPCDRARVLLTVQTFPQIYLRTLNKTPVATIVTANRRCDFIQSLGIFTNRVTRREVVMTRFRETSCPIIALYVKRIHHRPSPLTRPHQPNFPVAMEVTQNFKRCIYCRHLFKIIYFKRAVITIDS